MCVANQKKSVLCTAPLHPISEQFSILMIVFWWLRIITSSNKKTRKRRREKLHVQSFCCHSKTLFLVIWQTASAAFFRSLTSSLVGCLLDYVFFFSFGSSLLSRLTLPLLLLLSWMPLLLKLKQKSCTMSFTQSVVYRFDGMLCKIHVSHYKHTHTRATGTVPER